MSGSCIETPEAPAWLSKLESQREKLGKAKLGHDSGAGAACNACGPGCPGLDLHFWRKVCRACHCTKDVHDVQDDDMSGWAHFQLLGTAKPKKPNHAVIKIVGLSDEPVKLDWVPPNTSLDVVSDYMSSLGQDLAPVVGSDAAAKRREQLRRQIPLHDISSDLCCHKLTTQEQQEHQEYISHIKNQVVGLGNIVRVGTIQKGNVLSVNTEASQPVPGTKSYSLPLRVSSLDKGIKFTSIPKNTTDKHLVLDNMGNVITKSAYISDYKSSPIISHIVKDKLNIMRIESDRIKSAVEHGPIYDRLFKNLKNLNISFDNDVYLNPIKNFRMEFNLNPKFKDETTAFVESQGAKIVSPCSIDNNDNTLRNQIIPSQCNYSQNGTIFGPNGEIWSWTTHIQDPNNTTNANSNYISTGNKQEPLPYKSINSLEDDALPPLPNYNTYPGDLILTENPTVLLEPQYADTDLHQIQDVATNKDLYKMCYPENANITNYTGRGDCPQIPQNSYLADQLTERVAELQMNPNEQNKPYCTVSCQRCHLSFDQGQVAVKADRAGEQASWHPHCFTCAKCDELLADLVYFYYQGEVYCARDLANVLKIPRCYACDELIFSKKYTAAEGNYYHLNHFCCYSCDTPLGGKKYIPDDKTCQPICLDCDNKFNTEKCETCKGNIEAEQQGVSWSTFHWHGSCFNCANKSCCKSLLSGRFTVKNNKPYCSAACVNMQ